MAKVKVTDNSRKFERTIDVQSSVFLREMTDAIVNESERKTPRKFGDLRRNILKQVLGRKAFIRWMQKYAAYQEEIQYSNYTTPGTGPHFAENAVMKMIKKTGVIAKRVFR